MFGYIYLVRNKINGMQYRGMIRKKSSSTTIESVVEEKDLDE